MRSGPGAGIIAAFLVPGAIMPSGERYALAFGACAKVGIAAVFVDLAVRREPIRGPDQDRVMRSTVPRRRWTGCRILASAAGIEWMLRLACSGRDQQVGGTTPSLQILCAGGQLDIDVHWRVGLYGVFAACQPVIVALMFNCRR